MKKTVQLKEKIVSEAIKVFAKKGYADTSYQNIADELGISASAIFHHFENKATLLEALIVDITSRNHLFTSSEIKVEDNSQLRLKKHVLANFQWAKSKEDEMRIIVSLFGLSINNSQLEKLNRRIVETGRTRIVEILFMAKRENLLKKEIDPTYAGILIHQFLTGYIVHMASRAQNNLDEKSLPSFLTLYDHLEAMLFVNVSAELFR